MLAQVPDPAAAIAGICRRNRVRLFGGRKVDLRTPADLSVYSRDEVVRDALVAYVEP